MPAGTKSLYDTDFVEWSARTAELVRAGRLDEVDLEHVAEEIEDLGKNDRRSVKSLMLRLLVHQVKRHIQPERDTASWRSSIGTSMSDILAIMEDSPSLRRFLIGSLQAIYCQAVHRARLETGVTTLLPDECPFTLDQLLEQYDLEWPA